MYIFAGNGNILDLGDRLKIVWVMTICLSIIEGLIHLFATDAEDLETWEIQRDEYVVLLPHDPNLTQTRLSWQQLAAYPLIISSIGSCSTKVRQYLQRSPEPLSIAYEMREDSTMIGMAIQGLGAAIIPLLAATPVPPELQVYSLPTPLDRIIQTVILKDVHTPAIFAPYGYVKKL